MEKTQEMTNGERLIEILKKDGAKDFMGCLGFEFDEGKGVFYTKDGFGANWLVKNNNDNKV